MCGAADYPPRPRDRLRPMAAQSWQTAAMRVLRRILGLLAAAAVLALVLAAVAAALAWESAPRVSGMPVARAQPLLQLRELARRNDPRRARPGQFYVVHASPAELELLVGHAAAALGGAAQARLGDGSLVIDASLPLRRAAPIGWANLRIVFGDGATLPDIESIAIGRLALPGWAARPLVELIARVVDPGGGDAPPLRSLARGVRLTPDRVQLVYEWRADVPQRLFARLLPPEQQARLQVYHVRLAQALAAAPRAANVSALLQPLFALAAMRSAEGGDALAENRAALLTLALYATGRPLARALPQARGWPRLPWRPVVLRGRIDHAQHYLLSAAIAAGAGGALADVLGLAKEVSDAHDGSGFSFDDMAMNRAGTWLGEHAVSSPRALQARLAAGVGDAEIAPAVADLPGFLPDAVFVARFGGIGAPAYQRMMDEIESRVAALPLWAQLR